MGKSLTQQYSTVSTFNLSQIWKEEDVNLLELLEQHSFQTGTLSSPTKNLPVFFFFFFL